MEAARGSRGLGTALGTATLPLFPVTRSGFLWGVGSHRPGPEVTALQQHQVPGLPGALAGSDPATTTGLFCFFDYLPTDP